MNDDTSIIDWLLHSDPPPIRRQVLRAPEY